MNLKQVKDQFAVTWKSAWKRFLELGVEKWSLKWKQRPLKWTYNFYSIHSKGQGMFPATEEKLYLSHEIAPLTYRFWHMIAFPSINWHCVVIHNESFLWEWMTLCSQNQNLRKGESVRSLILAWLAWLREEGIWLKIAILNFHQNMRTLFLRTWWPNIQLHSQCFNASYIE